MQKQIIKTAFIWKLEIKLGNRRDEPIKLLQRLCLAIDL